MYGETSNTSQAGLAESHPRYAGSGRVCSLDASLRAAGLRPMLMHRGARVFAGGLTLVVTRDESTWADAAKALRDASAVGLPVGLHLSACIGHADLPETLTNGVIASLEGLRPESLLSVDGPAANAPVLERILSASRRPLRCFAFADGAPGAMPNGLSRAVAPDFVPGFPGEARFMPAMHAGIRSRCPLLAAEPTTTLLPAMALAVPAQTAWLPITLDLSRFLDASRDVDLPRLESSLDVAVDSGDELFDELTWCTERQREDARLNRRIAFCLTGLGDVVSRMGMEPASLDCLRLLDRLVSRIHERLWMRSAELSKRRSPLPALTEKQPSARWRDESHRQDWAQRWQQAVCKVQVRNRNLLAMSPYSIFPATGFPATGCADLMPLIAHADVVGFALPRKSPDWQRVDFQSFHVRMRAQINRFNATTLIAAGA